MTNLNLNFNLIQKQFAYEKNINCLHTIIWLSSFQVILCLCRVYHIFIFLHLSFEYFLAELFFTTGKSTHQKNNIYHKSENKNQQNSVSKVLPMCKTKTLKYVIVERLSLYNAICDWGSVLQFSLSCEDVCTSLNSFNRVFVECCTIRRVWPRFHEVSVIGGVSYNLVFHVKMLAHP